MIRIPTVREPPLGLKYHLLVVSQAMVIPGVSDLLTNPSTSPRKAGAFPAFMRHSPSFGLHQGFNLNPFHFLADPFFPLQRGFLSGEPKLSPSRRLRGDGSGAGPSRPCRVPLPRSRCRASCSSPRRGNSRGFRTQAGGWGGVGGWGGGGGGFAFAQRGRVFFSFCPWVPENVKQFQGSSEDEFLYGSFFE